MKFSIIVPIYKVEKYLEQCVESILSQSYKDFELILVDDGSPDKCPEICDQYSKNDSRVIVIHKENGGLSDARNAGMNIANGEYIIFVDSDDFWSKTSVLEKIADISKDNSPDIVQFGREKYFEKEDRIQENVLKHLSAYNGKSSKETLYNLVYMDSLAISAWSRAVKRDFLLKNDLYFKKGIKTEDLDWAIRMFLCEPKWAFIDDNFYVYRMQREGSITSTVDYKHLCDYCWIIENSIDLVEKCDDDLKVSLMSYLMYHVLIACAVANKVEIPKEQKKEILFRLKVVSKERITKYTLNNKVKLASYVYRICGFTVMAKALGVYLNNRGN